MTRSLPVVVLGVAIWACSRPEGPELGSLMDGNPIWLSDVGWQDKPEGVPGQFASGTVLWFQRSGEFRMAECTLTRLNGVVAVSEGDGFVRYTGTWKVSGRRIAVDYVLNSPTRLVDRPLVSGPAKHAFLDVTTRADRTRIVLSGVRFAPDRNLSKEAIALLLGP